MLRIARAVMVLLGVAALAVAAAVTPAQATGAQTGGDAVCPAWKLRGATGKYPAVTFGGAPAGSAVVTPTKVVLTKPAAGVDPGVEFATFALGVDLPAPAPITVDYQLSADASFAAGAIRLFYYHAQGADTLLDGPDGVAIATAAEGTLTIPASGKVGTLGLVYDASNSAAGSVTFTNLRIGRTVVKFNRFGCPPPVVDPTVSVTAPTCDNAAQVIKVTNPNRFAAVTVKVGGRTVTLKPGKTAPVETTKSVWVSVKAGAVWKPLRLVRYVPPVCPTPTAEPTPTPTAEPTAEPTATPTVAPTVPTVPVSNDDDQAGGLPVTGSTPLAAAGIGLLLLTAGAAGTVLARRRRTRFTA